MKESLIQKLFRTYRVPAADYLTRATSHFSFAEKIIFLVLVTALVSGTYLFLSRINEFFVTEVPVRGGSLDEGILGSPRFINPILAISDADRDLSALIYSGLVRATSEGRLIGDLAESFEVSEDGLVYNFKIKEGAVFQDGQPVSAEDVVFTVEKARSPALKSPKRASFEGVSVEAVGKNELRFTLKQPYAPFLENTTLGILPKHLWGEVTDEEFPFSSYNFDPVGSGPFEVGKIQRNSGGIPETYELKPFEKYTLGAPYLSRLVLHFFPSAETLEAAYQKGVIESANGMAPEKVANFRDYGGKILTTPLPRIFGVFLNQNQATLFVDKTVRSALNISAPREEIVKEVLRRFGETIGSAVPPQFLRNQTPNSQTPEERLQEARDILEKKGWKLEEKTGILTLSKKDSRGRVTGRTELSFSISTSNVPELKRSAEILKETWEKLGAKVDIKIFETGDLNQNVIRPRKYDSLLFGMVVGRDLDLFAFWHSSQRNDPGLNVAMYANTKADKLLSEARTLSNPKNRLENYRLFAKEVETDIPAIFLYAPEYIYVVPERLKGVDLRGATIPSERFLNVHEWYTDSEKVWSVFSD